MPGETISTLLSDVTREGGIPSAKYSNSDIMRVMTIAAHQINAEVMRVMKDNDFQGEKSTHDLVANQREYRNPSDLFKLKRVDLKIDGSNWRTARPFDANEVPDKLASEADIIANFSNDDPRVDIMDESYFIYSGTITNVTGGILLWYDKDIVGADTNGNDITSFSATTDVPTLITFACQALVLWAIIDWYENHPDEKKLARFNKKLWGEMNPNGRPEDDRKIGGLMRQIINHYSEKLPDRKMNFGSAHMQEYYENGQDTSVPRFGPR